MTPTALSEPIARLCAWGLSRTAPSGGQMRDAARPLSGQPKFDSGGGQTRWRSALNVIG